MIRLRNIVKRYNHIILDNINIDFEYGKIYILKGISGSGKTTLLNIIAGLDKNFEGEYLYFSQDRKHCSNQEEFLYQNNTNYIFQESLLISHLNVLDNLLFINYDFNKINKYAKQFKVDHLLKRFPKQLSGGEKQRISIVRALLIDSNLLIIDEATSSLDNVNSLEIAKEIRRLKDDSKIIIIATHKSIYDDMADEIINIKNGKTKPIIINDSINNIEVKHPKIFNKPVLDIKYSINKLLIKTKKWSSVFITSIFLLIIMLVMGFQQNFKKEFLDIQANKLPYHLFTIDIGVKEKLLENKNIKIYEEYKVIDNDLNVFALLEKEDSIFSNQDYLMLGTFPKNSKEILVNITYVEKVLNKIDMSEIIGQKITILNDKYTISGIITNDSDKGVDIFYSNPFYSMNFEPTVFMPYEELKKIGKIENSTYQILGSYKNIYEDLETYNEVLNLGASFPLNEKIESAYSNINLFLNIILIVSVVILVITFMFLYNQITLELHYRNKEFGYLRLFHVSKKRLRNIVLIEYFARMLLSFIISILMLILTIIIFANISGMNFMPSFYTIIGIFIFLTSYVFSLIYIPLHKSLKKSILQLIK